MNEKKILRNLSTILFIILLIRLCLDLSQKLNTLANVCSCQDRSQWNQ